MTADEHYLRFPTVLASCLEDVVEAEDVISVGRRAQTSCHCCIITASKEGLGNHMNAAPRTLSSFTVIFTLLQVEDESVEDEFS